MKSVWSTRVFTVIVCGTFFGTPFSPFCGAQTNTEKPEIPTPTLHVDVNVVTVPATVRNKKGEIIRNLTKDNFLLSEDGEPIQIRYFSQESDLPFALGLMIDSSGSQRAVLDEERTASKKFLTQMLTNTKDTAFLIQFDHEVNLLEDITSSKEKLSKGLDYISSDSQGSAPQPQNQNEDAGQPPPRRGGTLLYDSVYLAGHEVLEKQTGRKAIVLLTDGVDHGSHETLLQAIEAAQRTDTIVYAIYFKGKNGGGGHHGPGGFPGIPMGGGGFPGGGGRGGWPGGGNSGGGMGGGGNGGPPPGSGGGGPHESDEDGRKVLERMTRETGGRLFEAGKKESLDDIYAHIAEELRSQYLLGYTPASNLEDGYHHLTLKTKDDKLTVQSRQGFYTGK